MSYKFSSQNCHMAFCEKHPLCSDVFCGIRFFIYICFCSIKFLIHNDYTWPFDKNKPTHVLISSNLLIENIVFVSKFNAEITKTCWFIYLTDNVLSRSNSVSIKNIKIPRSANLIVSYFKVLLIKLKFNNWIKICNKEKQPKVSITTFCINNVTAEVESRVSQ